MLVLDEVDTLLDDSFAINTNALLKVPASPSLEVLLFANFVH
jgi:superfamily II DNA/RNA helicase